MLEKVAESEVQDHYKNFTKMKITTAITQMCSEFDITTVPPIT